MSTLQTLTSIIDFTCMAVAIWLATYLFARGRNNRLAFRAVIMLVALAFYYLMAFTAELDPEFTNPRLRAGAMLVAIVMAHNLTYYLLPEELQKKFHWLARAVIAGSLVAAGFLIAAPLPIRNNPYTISLPTFDSLSVVVSLFSFLVSLAILYNLFLITRFDYHPMNNAFYLALLMGMGSVMYAAVATVLRLPSPRLLPTLFMLTAFGLLVYSISRYQVLIERRTINRDLPLTFLIIFGLTFLVVLIISQLPLTAFEITIIAILMITTLSVYDLARETLTRRYYLQVISSWRQVHEHARATNSTVTLQENLEIILKLLTQNMQATSGFIAIQDIDGYHVNATCESIPLNTILSENEVKAEEISRPFGHLSGNVEWIVPAYSDSSQLAVIGLGRRKGLKDYTQNDFHWMEDVADHIAQMVTNTNITNSPHSSDSEPILIDQQILSTLIIKPDTELIKDVEFCLKHLHDYPVLGKSPLADMLHIVGSTHIERGRALSDVLVTTIEILRPTGDRPRELPPREWYNYVVLFDAYVDDINDREVMARLYISEATFYRTRRKAVRGVARALLEMAQSPSEHTTLATHLSG